MDTAGLEGGSKGVLHAIARHGGGGGGHPDTATARRGKEPHWMAVGEPILAEQLQSPLWQGHIAVLGAFAAAHMDEHPGTINIRHLYMWVDGW